jgi:nitroreductase
VRIIAGFIKMKTLMDIIRRRYSVRGYQSRPIEREKIEAMAEAARLAPSASNGQPWRFIVVTDPRKRSELVEKGLGGVVPNRWAETAPVIVVGCAKLNVLTHRLAEAAKGIHYHQIDLGIAMEHMVLRATEMGIGSCWIGWFKEKPIKKILEVPRAWRVISLLALGYSAQDEPREKDRLPLHEILFFNRFSRSGP